MSYEIATSHTSDKPGVLGRQRRHGVAAKILTLCTKSNFQKIVVIVAMLAIIWLYVAYFASFIFTKPQKVRIGGFAYSNFVSDFVKELPAFKPLEKSEKYFINIFADGNTPVNIMRYDSDAPVEEIISYYRLYFEIVNFTYKKHRFDSDAIAIFRNTHEEFAVYVESRDHWNSVSIENTRYD